MNPDDDNVFTYCQKNAKLIGFVMATAYVSRELSLDNLERYDGENIWVESLLLNNYVCKPIIVGAAASVMVYFGSSYLKKKVSGEPSGLLPSVNININMPNMSEEAKLMIAFCLAPGLFAAGMIMFPMLGIRLATLGYKTI
jgi:hypothetical protein